MVFFTCNHCGESVKKPSVEKHYNTKCRGAPKSISCMDCQKDFQDNYVEHVKCITELEKYSGKDYVPRESVNSGAKKQEGWVETVRAVLDSREYKLSNTTRQAFEMLQKYDNVPRKKAKFLNFVSNSVRIPRSTIEEVWNILEKEQEKLKQGKQKHLEVVKTEKLFTEQRKQKLEQNGHLDEVENYSKEKATTDEDECSKHKSLKPKEKYEKTFNDTSTKEKKNLSKKQKMQNNDNNSAADDGDIGKKKQEQQDAMKTSSNIHENVPNIKKKKTDAHSEFQDSVDEVLENSSDKIEKKKKIKSHSLDKGDIEAQPHENGHVAEIKNKKKRATNTEEVIGLDIPAKKQKLNGKVQNNNKSSNDGEEVEAYTFCWDYEFTNIMSKYADGVDMEKLKRKILKKYKAKFSGELTERQQYGFEKKFNKKLKKNSLLKIEGDVVKYIV